MEQVSQATVNIKLASYQEWNRGAARLIDSGLTPFVIKDPTGAKLRIVPALSEHEASMILGFDWLPISASGATTLEGMVHTPSLYADKIRNLQGQGDQRALLVEAINETSRPIALIGGSRNYYHWLIDYVPRLLLLRQLGLLSGLAVLVNDDLAPFQLETFRLLGVSSEDLLTLADSHAIRCERALIPTLLASTTVVHPAAIQMLREALLPEPAVLPRRRLYVSREDASTRRFTNEDELVSMLAKHGFEKHLLANLGLKEQVALFANAEAVVGAHGAGLTNVLFAPKGARVVEIYSPAHKVSSMKVLCLLAGLTHRFVPAMAHVQSVDSNPLLSDSLVDIASLGAALDGLGLKVS